MSTLYMICWVQYSAISMYTVHKCIKFLTNYNRHPPPPSKIHFKFVCILFAVVLCTLSAIFSLYNVHALSLVFQYWSIFSIAVLKYLQCGRIFSIAVWSICSMKYAAERSVWITKQCYCKLAILIPSSQLTVETECPWYEIYLVRVETSPHR